MSSQNLCKDWLLLPAAEEQQDGPCASALAALTKRSVADRDLCAFVQQCLDRCKGGDRAGLLHRALYVATACGRTDVVRWLLCQTGCGGRGVPRHEETGCGLLHASVYYGKINVAVTLLRLGESFNLSDKDGAACLEQAHADTIAQYSFHVQEAKAYLPNDKPLEAEVYVWGSNTNYTIGPTHARDAPEMLDAYHKNRPTDGVNQICLERFHSALVTTDGNVFTCGHGRNGRLGLNAVDSVVTPAPVGFNTPKPTRIRTAAIALDHSVFLSEKNQVWTTGDNTHRVLGHVPAPARLLCPQPIAAPLFGEVTGICAGRFHTLAWNPQTLWVWGLNVGQLGAVSRRDHIELPRPIASHEKEEFISGVASSDAATVVAVSAGYLTVFHQYQVQKVALKFKVKVRAMSVFGGTLDWDAHDDAGSARASDLRVAVLTASGHLYLWQQSDPAVRECLLGGEHALSNRVRANDGGDDETLLRRFFVNHVQLNGSEMLLTTDTGEAFRGVVKFRKKNVAETDVEGEAMQLVRHRKRNASGVDDNFKHVVKTTKVANVYRAYSIHSDPRGQNFAVLQALPGRNRRQAAFVSPSTFSADMRLLLDGAGSNGVGVVDFKLSTGRTVSAHRFVLASSSPVLDRLISETTTGCGPVELPDTDPDVFAQLLLAMYTGDCELLRSGPCARTFPSCENPVRALRETAERFGVAKLASVARNYKYYNGAVTRQARAGRDEKVAVRFGHESFPQLHDVVIRTKSKVDIGAHKCILAARLEYFDSVFSLRWNESSSSVISLPYSTRAATDLLVYLYTDGLPPLVPDDLDHACSLLVLSDELFVTRLKEHSELALLSCLSLRNVCDMLAFAFAYNAEQLKRGCMEFVCLNLEAMLESRGMEALDDDILSCLTDFYYRHNPRMCYRDVLPHPYAPSDEEVAEAGRECSISFEKAAFAAPKPSQRRRARPRKSSESCNASNASTEETSVTLYPEIAEGAAEGEPSSPQPLSPVQIRLKAIQLAAERVAEEDDQPDYTSIGITSRSEFPDLASSRKLPGEKLGGCRQKFSRLSQRERKRLDSEASNEPAAEPQPAKSPWKTIPEPETAGLASDDANERNRIDSIVSDEKKLKGNLVSMRSKHFGLTQMEDKAIEELHRFYNVDAVFDEIVTVGRAADPATALPVWINKSKVK